jgi:uncharacterized protein YegJ (DUF2314 family)
MRGCLILLVLSVVTPAATRATNTTELAAVLREAGQNYQTKEGQRYEEQFLKAISPAFAAALKECGNSPDTKEPATIVFIIAASGHVRRLLHSQNIRFGDCVAAKLKSISTLPPPPRDSYVVALGAANHEHEEKSNGPPDKPTGPMTKESVAAYDRAIAPYVAKARATYPAAKKRFLTGLPPGYRFSVRTPLIDRNGKREDSFVRVESIQGGKITGIIVNDLHLVTDYKTGQRITFPENGIDNWVILRPDGTEGRQLRRKVP